MRVYSWLEMINYIQMNLCRRRNICTLGSDICTKNQGYPYMLQTALVTELNWDSLVSHYTLFTYVLLTDSVRILLELAFHYMLIVWVLLLQIITLIEHSSNMHFYISMSV